jgi:hypothetical protein
MLKFGENLFKIPVRKLIKWGVGIALAIFGGAQIYHDGKYQDDNKYEEIAEDAIESILGSTFNIPSESLKDTIDLSPWSNEDAESR